jgi:predicted nuclease of predicted toxin-antitoxin system
MRILLDEYVPRKLKNSFTGHTCQTVPEAGLAGRKNGELLSLAEQIGFEVLLTMDKGIEYEQNVKGRRIAVVLLRAKSNRLADLLPHVPACHALLLSIQPGQLSRLES